MSLTNKFFQYSLSVIFIAACLAGDAGAQGREFRGNADLPREMIDMGFGLEQVDLTDGNKTWELAMPSPGVSGFLSSLKVDGQWKHGRFTDIAYVRNGAIVTVELKTNLGERAFFQIDTAKETVYYANFVNGVKEAERNDHYIKDRSVVRAISDKRKYSKPDPALDYVAVAYDSKRKKLKIAQAGTDKVVRELDFDLPQGVDIKIVDGKYLVFTDTKSNGFPFSAILSGRDLARSFLLDVSDLLRIEPRFGRKEECEGRPVGSIDYVMLGKEGALQSGMQGTLQGVFDYFMTGLNREEAAKYGQTREGMRLYRSSTGKSSLYVDEKSLGSGKPSVKIGDEWRPICSITPSAQADGSYVFKETGRGNDWKVVFDKDAGTYSAKKSD